mgnify:CR=1 FL=1
MWWQRLDTPCAIVHRALVERNAGAMRRRARELGVALRPHVKTHKTVEGARIQHGGAIGPVTVSTLAEARHLADAGFDDITWAVPPAPQRLGEAMALIASGVRLGLILDRPEPLDRIGVGAGRAGVEVEVWLEVDCGGGRSGVDPRDPAVVELGARMADSPRLDFRGLLTHAGQAYHRAGREALAAAAAAERDAVVDLARRLRAAGTPVPGVSVGSTPTAVAAEDLTGVTEARPGNYVFFDAFQAAIGACDLGDVAFSVLATVIAGPRERGRVVVDAGALALSRDPGPTHVDPRCGFGVVCTPAGEPVPGLRLTSLSQEHGVVEAGDPAVLQGLEVGSRVRILPNHSCLAAACHDRYHVVADDEVVEVWRPCRGW